MNETKESFECMRYHEYIRILGDVEKDQTIPFYQRWTSSFLHYKISRHHMIKCVYPEVMSKKYR